MAARCAGSKGEPQGVIHDPVYGIVEVVVMSSSARGRRSQGSVLRSTGAPAKDAAAPPSRVLVFSKGLGERQ